MSHGNKYFSIHKKYSNEKAKSPATAGYCSSALVLGVVQLASAKCG
jgi:hypothetical protein